MPHHSRAWSPCSAYERRSPDRLASRSSAPHRSHWPSNRRSSFNASSWRWRRARCKPSQDSSILVCSGTPFQLPDLTTLLANQTNLSFGLDKPLRSGLIISPSIGIARQDLAYDPLATNRANVGFGVTQPLMRGRGTEVVTAAETAARYEVAATTSDLRYTAALSVYQTTVAYWNYLTAYRTREIVLASEGRARRLVDELQTLIDAGNRPAADIREVRGNLAERMALRASYDQAVFESRQALGLAMGLPADRAAALPAPTDDFPLLLDTLPPPGDPYLVDTALANRADLDATRQRGLETDARIGAARDALRPQVDLQMNVGYSGLAEGSQFPGLLTSLGRRLAGPTFLASVAVSQSKERNTARGQLAQTDAARRQTQIRLDDLSRAIRSGVAVADDDLARSAERSRLLHEAATLYQLSVEDERQKMQLGRSTIIELVLIEDRLTRSLLDEVSSTQAFAAALARLRFETGTLVSGTAPDFLVTAEALTTVPRAGIQ